MSFPFMKYFKNKFVIKLKNNKNMSCDSNDDELKFAKEYKYLLSYIRPLIGQLDKSRDARLCLLWLSKLEQCSSWERGYRNKFLSELCRQVKANSLKPPFNASPPKESLRKISFGDQRELEWKIIEHSDEGSSEEIVSSSSQLSFASLKNLCKRQFSTQTSQVRPWKQVATCNSSTCNMKNKNFGKPANEISDHSECFAVQKAYHERAESDQMVIEKYQEIIKSLVSQQLKADASPRKFKKLQSLYESKMSELVYSLKKTQEESKTLKEKILNISRELDNLKSQNESLKTQVVELEEDKNFLESKCKQVEKKKIMALSQLKEKLNESEKKLKESEKRFMNLEKKQEEIYNDFKNEHNTETLETEKKYFGEISNLKRLLQEKQTEIIHMKEQMSSNMRIHSKKSEFSTNSGFEKDQRKIKILKGRAKKLEKVQEHMTILFQTHLQQILSKKDLYIATLEAQLKMNSSESEGSALSSDLQNIVNQKVSNLETQYRKILEDSERQSLQRRQQDLQKIHTLEKQLLLTGGAREELDPKLNRAKSSSLTSVNIMGSEEKVGKKISK